MKILKISIIVLSVIAGIVGICTLVASTSTFSPASYL